MKPSETDVRSFVLEHISTKLEEAGVAVSAVDDSTDLLADGVVDSLGVLELIATVTQHYGLDDEWDDFDADDLLVIGPFCRYVAERAPASA